LSILELGEDFRNVEWVSKAKTSNELLDVLLVRESFDFVERGVFLSQIILKAFPKSFGRRH
jgi:hypothetical protein